MNVMDMLLRDIDPIAVKKIDEIAKEKKISRQEFLKGQVETLAVFQEQKDRDKQKKEEKSQNGFTKFFARHSGANSSRKQKETQEMER